MKAVHLSPRVYSSLQDFVHHGHRETFATLRNLLKLAPGESVLEIGCGTGMLARRFIQGGYDYWGIDFDPERIAEASRALPSGQFRVCNALDLGRIDLPGFQRIFIHGVLHHLSDGDTRQLLDHLMTLPAGVVLAIVEPFRPRRWWANPLGEIFGRIDEGKFVRTLDEWKSLFAPNLDELTTRSLWPRWPVGFLDARLTPRRSETE